MSKTDPISLDGVKSYSLKDRSSKVDIHDFAKPWRSGGEFEHWIDSLPKILAGNDFKRVTDNMVRAVRTKKMIILAMGAHGIKVGLNP